MSDYSLLLLFVGIFVGWLVTVVYREMTKGIKCPMCRHRSAGETLRPIDIHPHAESQREWESDPTSPWYRKPIFPWKADGTLDMTVIKHKDGTTTFGYDSKCANGCVFCGKEEHP